MEETMNKIFQARHWQLFITFLLVSFLQEMARGISDLFDTLLYLFLVILYIGWLLFLGSRLRTISPNPQLNYRVFLFVGYTLIAIIITFRLTIFFKPDLLKSFDTMTIILSMVYLLISLIILTSFVGKNLKAIEVGDDIDINDYFSDIFGLIFWPIGIWTFQPRINRLATRLAR